MIIHPNFNPVALQIGPLAIRWYALSYLVGFALFMWFARQRAYQRPGVITRSLLDDFFTYGVLGVIIGGRLGYVMFYKPAFYFSNPLEIFKVWNGGMSFHGGLLGVIIAMWIFSWRRHISFRTLADTVALFTPLGLACGRIGNFINGELWGRITRFDAFWAVGFPQAAQADWLQVQANPERFTAIWEQFHALPRHPSQLYQAALEGITLWLVLMWFARRDRPEGQIMSLFLLGYGIARFIVEFAREPDDFLGLLSAQLSLGQWLSVPMILLGAWGMLYYRRRA